MQHPYSTMTTEDALQIARNLIHGPGYYDHEKVPMPSFKEALEAIEDYSKRCGHQWLTGHYAKQVLQKELGMKVKWSGA